MCHVPHLHQTAEQIPETVTTGVPHDVRSFGARSDDCGVDVRRLVRHSRGVDHSGLFPYSKRVSACRAFDQSMLEFLAQRYERKVRARQPSTVETFDQYRTLSVRCSVPGVDGCGLCPVGYVSGNSLSTAFVGYSFFEIIDDFGDVTIGVHVCLSLWSRWFVGYCRRG